MLHKFLLGIGAGVKNKKFPFKEITKNLDED
jgi:hypothetical protein